MFKLRFLANAILLLATVSIANGAPVASPTTHIRGTVKSLSGKTLIVTTSTGPVTVQLPTPVNVATVVASSRSQIEPGSYIGIASVTQDDGTQRAAEIHVFPPSLRGAGEGSFPWDYPGSAGKKSKMTNGTVSAPSVMHSKMTNGTVAVSSTMHSKMTNGTVSGSASSSILTLTYKDGPTSGAQPIVIPANIPIVTFGPGTIADLVPGTRVFIIGTTLPSGTVAAIRVLAGKNGIDPPM